MQNDATETRLGGSSPWLTAIVAFLLAATTAGVFWPATRFEFLTYDDHDYVTGNAIVQQGLRLETLQWAFTTGHASNWHPLTWLSHALDCQIYGVQPAGHHATNVLLHALNSALLFLLLHSWTGSLWRSAFVAAVFAWHPLRVESVAWVAERKDLLSGFFFFLMLMAYSRFVRVKTQAEASKRATVLWYIVALILFTAALMSKPSVVTVPFLLLLLDAWPFERWEPFVSDWWRSLARLLPEKIPFFVLTIASCVATYSVQKAGNAVRDFSLVSRLCNVPMAYVQYLRKLVYPADLAVIYPFNTVSPVTALIAAAVLLAISSLILYFAARHRYAFTGWFWFMGVLVPMIGLVQVGGQSFADRYTYLAATGLSLIVAWSAPELCRRFNWRPLTTLPVVAAMLTGLLVMTHSYLLQWHDSVSLFTHAIQVTGPHTAALKNLGLAHMEKREFAEAQVRFQQSLQIEPGDQPTMFNLGSVLLQQGYVSEGVVQLRKALRPVPAPSQVPAYIQIAILLEETNQFAEAAGYYESVLAADPNSPTALNNLAWLRATAADPSFRNGPTAVRLGKHLCEITHRRIPQFLGTLAAAHAEAGQFAEAIATAEEARDKARAGNQDALVKSNEELIALYRANRPYRQGPKHN